MQHDLRSWKVGVGAVNALQPQSMHGTEVKPAFAEQPELAEQADRRERMLYGTASQ